MEPALLSGLTKPLVDKIQASEEINFDIYNDIFTNYEYYHLVKSKAIDDNSILLMLLAVPLIRQP